MSNHNLKMATVTPVPKSGDLSQVSNFRPISLLPLPGKSVLYPKLLKKLKDIEISPVAFTWLESYLNNRLQRVIANGTHSTYLPVTQRVTQGSILGLLLYIIYTYDIAARFTKCKSMYYADNAVLVAHGKDITEIERSLQSDSNNLQASCYENSLFNNSTKTKYMIFDRRNKLSETPNNNLIIEGVALKRVFNYTYLGVTLDKQLNCEQHPGFIIKRVSDEMYQLGMLCCFLNTKAALSIYKKHDLVCSVNMEMYAYHPLS